MSGQFVAFVLVGGFAAAVNFLSRIGFSQFMSYAPAIISAYGLGMITAFLLNRRFVFTDAVGSTHGQLLRFCVVNLLAVLQTLLISVGLADYLFPLAGMTFHPKEVAHAVGVAAPILTSYVGHRQWSFARR